MNWRSKVDPSILFVDTADELVKNYDELLRHKYEISYSEWRLLLAVLLSGDKPAQEKVAEYAMKSPAAVSRQVKVLQKKGLLKQLSSKSSNRKVELHLTKKGQSKLHSAMMDISSISRKLMRSIPLTGSDMRESMMQLLDIIYDQRES